MSATDRARRFSEHNAAWFDNQVTKQRISNYRTERMRRLVEYDSPADTRTFATQLLGPLQGKQVLDVGCGEGHNAVRLALRGATVHAVDVSAVSVAETRRLAAQYNVEDRVHASIQDLHAPAFPDASFDLLSGFLVLHHLDHALTGREMSRLLRPDGKAVFMEPSAANPLIMLARQYLNGRFGIHRVTDQDIGDHPITQQAIEAIGQHFTTTYVYHHEFLFFRLIYHFGPVRAAPIKDLLRALDRYAGLVPGLLPYTYTFVLEFRK